MGLNWKRCWQFLASEFHYSKLFLFHHDWKAFTYTPLLPYKWQYQLLYVVYRWLLAIYISCWIGETWKTVDGVLYFAYLTSWAYMALYAYLVTASISTTISFLSAHYISPRQEEEFVREPFGVRKRPSGCFGRADNKISRCQMLHWLLFTIGSESALVVTLLYWVLLYRGGHVSAVSTNTHLVNGLLAMLDLWLCGLPVNLLHGIYIIIAAGLYVVFTSVYFSMYDSVIYDKFLDYEDMMGVAVAVVLCSILLLLPMVHTVCFYLQHLARDWVVQYFLNRISQRNQEEQEDGMQEPEANGSNARQTTA